MGILETVILLGTGVLAVSMLTRSNTTSVATATPAPVTGSPPARNGCAYEMLPPAHRACCLKKMRDNVTVSGKVVTTNPKELDGDFTFNITPDPDSKQYLLGGVKEIHCEIVCQHTSITTLPFKKGVQCITPPYSAWIKIPMPKVGSHVKVTGTWTQDVREGGKAEIHPVCSVTVV